MLIETKKKKKRYLARLGELDLYDDNDGASPVTIPLIKAAVHEEYNPTSFTNDIAVLTLEFEAEGRKFNWIWRYMKLI